MPGAPSPKHNVSKPYRWAIPLEVVPKIDALKAQGHSNKTIGAALGVHWQTVYNVLKRNGAYKGIPND